MSAIGRQIAGLEAAIKEWQEVVTRKEAAIQAIAILAGDLRAENDLLKARIERILADYHNACAENHRFREALTMIATEEPNGNWATDFARTALAT